MVLIEDVRSHDEASALNATLSQNIHGDGRPSRGREGEEAGELGREEG